MNKQKGKGTLGERLTSLYVQTFKSLEPEAKSQLQQGFMLIAVALVVVGLGVMSLGHAWLTIGGLSSSFGLAIFFVSRILFK